MVSGTLRQQVYDRWGKECVICGRSPEKWSQSRSQEDLSIHHIDGDPENSQIDNLIPVCQSCHKSIHRFDEPPYRFYHRQLPPEDRNSIDHYSSDVYGGTALSKREVIEKHGQEIAKPKSVRYEKYEDWEFDDTRFPRYYHENS